MAKMSVLFNLVIIDLNFIEHKVRNVRDYVIVNNELHIYTYYEQFRSIIKIAKNECYMVYKPLQHNQHQRIF